MTKPEDDPNVVDGEVVDETPAAALAVPSSPLPDPDYNEGGVPSFDFVRDKIENRYTTSVGSTEVAGLGTDNTVDALDKKIGDRDQAAKDRLAEIRRSMRGE
jgi:hypothetical protein